MDYRPGVNLISEFFIETVRKDVPQAIYLHNNKSNLKLGVSTMR